MKELSKKKKNDMKINIKYQSSLKDIYVYLLLNLK
jgi:hypothetical protein